MKVLCSKCSQEIPAAGINVSQGIAFCAACGEVFNLGTLVRSDDDLKSRRLQHPARTKITLLRDKRRLAIALPRGAAKGTGCALLFFAALWNGLLAAFLVAILFAAFHADSSPPPQPDGTYRLTGWGVAGMLFFFMVPFILLGLGVALAALYNLFGQTVVAMDRTGLIVERRLFGRGWKKKYLVDDVTEFQKAGACTSGEAPVYGVKICFASRRSVTFGTGLTEDEQNWLVGELTSFHKESVRPPVRSGAQ